MSRLTRLNLQGLVYQDLGQVVTDNEDLTAAMVNSALTLGEQDFYRRTRLKRRMTAIFPDNAQARVTLPRDTWLVKKAYWDDDTVELGGWSEDEVRVYDYAFRTATIGEPIIWYMRESGVLGLYPPPEVTAAEALTIEGYIVPYSIGNGITSIGRSAYTVTVATSTAHELVTGDIIEIAGLTSTVASLVGIYAVTVTSTTGFTYTHASSGTITAVLNLGGVKFTNDCAIDTVVRATNVVTVVTKQPHNFLVSDTVLVHGVTTASFNGSQTVASVVSAVSFTYAQTAADASSSGGGVASSGAVLPMLVDGDIGTLPVMQEMAPAYFAVGHLAPYLILDPHVQAIVQRDAAMYMKCVSDCIGDRL